MSARVLQGAVLRRGQRGLAAVEFVIAAPVLLFLTLASAEVGRAFVHYITLSNAVRDAARYLCANALNGAGVVAPSATTLTAAKNLAVYGNAPGTGNAVLPSYTTANVTLGDAGGGNVFVATSYTYQPMIAASLPTFGLGPPIPMGVTFNVRLTMRAL